MSMKERTSKALALLIPAGVLGISSALAAVQARAEAPNADIAPAANSVAERLHDIRSAVSSANHNLVESVSGAKLLLADWLNFGGGWRNGGWRNGGWHNGGWGNGGWGNGGWGNGGWHNWGNGWHNWGNGWHNGWHNFWHNW